MKAPATSGKMVKILGAALFALTILAFARTFTMDFVKFDDFSRIVANPRVQQGLNPDSIQWAFTTGYEGDFNPLAWTSHIIDWSLFGNKAGGHHAVNVLIHATSVLMLFLVLHLMTGSVWRSALVAAVWAVHPLRVESVAWISQRKDVLCTLFWILSMGAYTIYARKPSARRYALVVLAVTASLLSKPMAITLPFALLLMDWWPLGRMGGSMGAWEYGRCCSRPPQRPDRDHRGLRTPATEGNMVAKMPGERSAWRLILEKVPLLVIAGVVSVLSYRATSGVGGIYSFGEIGFISRVENAFVSYLRYIGKLFWPANLSIHYPYPESSLLIPATLSVLVLCAITAGLIAVARKHPYAITGWLWYLGTLVPVIGFIQAGNQAMADRYTYIPHIGLLIALVWGVGKYRSTGVTEYRSEKKTGRAGDGGSERLGATTAAVLIVLVLAGLTVHQTGYWRNGITLFRRAVAITDRNYVAHCVLGTALAQNGDHGAAIAEYRRAISIHEAYPDAHYNWANSLIAVGRTDEAIVHYHHAIAMRPTADSLRNIASALNMKGQFVQAEKYCREALALAPGSDEIQANMGIILQNLQRLPEAADVYARALEINPRNFIAEYGLASCHLLQGRYADAIRHFQITISLRPDYPDAYFNMANAMLASGMKNDALNALYRALALAQESGNSSFASMVERRIAATIGK